MLPEDMDSDLIGFQNNFPVMKKIKLEMGNVGKRVILNGSSMSGKIFIVNKQNVKIPLKLCDTIPEEVRKVVLGNLPENIDKNRVEVTVTRDKVSYLNNDKQESGTSHSSNQTAGKLVSSQNSVVVISSNIINKEIETKSIKMDSASEIERRDRKRKRQALSRQQHHTIKREVMRCVKQSMKKQLKTPVKTKLVTKFDKKETKSVSCQTSPPVEYKNSSIQTERVIEVTPSMDILSIFSDLEKEEILLGSPCMSPGKIMFETGKSPIPIPQLNYSPVIGIDDHFMLGGASGNMGYIDPKKLRFYECLKNCDSTDAAGHIPLHLGVLSNNPLEVHNQCLMLKTRNIPVDVPNNTGMTPLHLAVLNECDLKIMETLLSNGANPLTKDNEGNTSLHNAVLFNASKDILVTLLKNIREHSEEVDAFNYEGFTPLMLCVIENKFEMAVECVQAGADPNTKDQKSGRTSLFHAVENNNLDLVKLFMKHGANTKIKNFFGTSTHEATFELENINPDIKALVIGKESVQNRPKPTVSRKKKNGEKGGESQQEALKNKLKTVRILKIINNTKDEFK